MADDDRYLTGSGYFDPEKRSASYNTDTSFGPFSGGAILSGQDEGVPMYGGRFTTQLPEGLSATLSRTNQAGAPVEYARDAIRLAKQLEAGQLAFEASRTGSDGVPSYGLQYGAPIGKQGGAKPYYPAPSGNWYVEAGGTPHTPERHIMLGAKGRFADGGSVDAALHAIRHHLAGGGFLSDLFSGPDYLSTGKEASFANMDPNSESTADFFKADRALRLAREVQAAEPDRDTPLPLRRPAPEAAPRQQVAAPAPAPTPAARRIETLPGDTVEPHDFPPALERTIGPYDFGQAVSGGTFRVNPPHLTETPGFGQTIFDGRKYADTTPEINSRDLQNYTLPEAAFAPPVPQAEINNAVSLAQNLSPQQEAIPSAADSLAAVEKFQNAGIFSGNEYDKAGEILAAHNRAMFDNIPVEEALRLNRAEGPRMVNQGMPVTGGTTRDIVPLAYTAAPTPAPAQASTAIDQATGKLTARIPDEPHGTALTKQQADYVIRTIAAETSGKSPEETQAIASVILNRINSGRYGSSPEAVLFAKRQFEPWMNPAGKNYPMNISPKSQRYSDARDALEAAMAGEDITGGATHFWGPKAQFALGRPAPSWGRTGGVDIGETRFHNLSRAEGGEVDDYAGGGKTVSKALKAVQDLFDSPGMTQWREKSVIPASKVEDRYYTGTSKDKDFPNFKVEGHGAWFTKDPSVASMYAAENDSKGFKRDGWDMVPVNTADRVIPAYLRAENPFTGPLPESAMADNYKKAQTQWFDQLRAQGHDAWMPESDPNLAVILKNQSDIKSALSNSGDFDLNAPRIDRAHGGLVDDALHVVREHHADGEAVGQAPVATDNSERVRAAESAANLAKQIQAYEASMESIRQQPKWQEMSHAPEKPRAPISVEALGKNREFGSAPYDVAGPLSSFAQGAYDMKTLPLYMYPPTAPLGMAIDTAEGVASGSPTQVAMGALGGPLKVARNVIAPLAVATGVTAPDEAEAGSLSKLFGKMVSPAKRAENLVKFKAGNVENVPSVVYHGTGNDIHQFDTTKGAWFTDTPSLASEYANKPGGNVVPAHIALKNPIEFVHAEQRKPIGEVISTALSGARDLSAEQINAAKPIVDVLRKRYGKDARPLFEYWNNDPDVTKLFKTLGYDGISAFEKADRKAKTWSIFSPEQAKSAIGNAGMFDPTKARLNEADGGSVEDHALMLVSRQA